MRRYFFANDLGEKCKHTALEHSDISSRFADLVCVYLAGFGVNRIGLLLKLCSGLYRIGVPFAVLRIILLTQDGLSKRGGMMTCLMVTLLNGQRSVGRENGKNLNLQATGLYTTCKNCTQHYQNWSSFWIWFLLVMGS